MSLFIRLLTWWNSQTLNTQVWTKLYGEKVGEDDQGNIFYQSGGGKRRWVIYNGESEASRIAPEWHGWLHHTFKEPPTRDPLTHKPWELLYARFSYRDSTGSRPIEAFREAIDSVQAGPPSLGNLAILPGGGLNLTVIGGPRAPLSVEWSTNLNQWQATGTTIPADATFPYTLPPLNGEPSAFLRVRRVN